MQHRHSTNLNMHVSIYSPGRQNFKQWKDLRQITPRQCSRRCSSWRESKGRSAHTIHARVLHLHGSWTHHGKPLPWARWCWGSAWCKPRRRQVWRGICSLRLHGVSRLRVLSRVCQRRSLLAHCRRCWDQHHSCRRRGSSRWRRGSCHGEETPRQVPTQSSNRQRLSPSLLFMSKNRTESINVCEIIVHSWKQIEPHNQWPAHRCNGKTHSFHRLDSLRSKLEKRKPRHKPWKFLRKRHAEHSPRLAGLGDMSKPQAWRLQTSGLLRCEQGMAKWQSPFHNTAPWAGTVSGY